MALDIAGVIRCESGYFVWGKGEDELLQAAELHVRSAHPDLLGTVSPLELAQPVAKGEVAA